MMRWQRSLQGRLLALVLGVVAAVWLATASLTWLDVRGELDELLDSHLAQAAALLVAQQTHESEDDDRGVDAPSLHRYAPKVAFQVFNEGRLVLRSANAPVRPMAEDAAGAASGFRTELIDGVAWRVFTTRGAERDVQVYVGEQLDSRAAILWAVLRSTLWPMAFALPLLAAAVWWAVNRGVAPLRGLGHTLAERRPQALDAVVVDGAPSEMLPMLDALNGLFARISGLMESERRFTADAAHELRTPIAAIRTQAQVAAGADEDAARRHALQATLDGCDRATRLVEQMLTLSRLEAGTAAPMGAVELRELARSVVAELAPQALRKDQTIELAAEQALVVAGDATLLAVLLRNLVDNAIRYSPSAATVRVSVERDALRVRLRVDDSGPGMSPADMQRMGERFFRVIGSGQAGSGLGGSIVRRIAAVHLLELEVRRSAALGGLAVEIGWPGSDQAPSAAPGQVGKHAGDPS